MTFGPDRLETAIARVEALPDATARDVAREAVAAVLGFHREAVLRLASRVRETNAGEDILRAAAEDEVVASLLSLHGAHPSSLETRVRRALDKIGAAEDGAAGHVEVLSIDAAAIQLRVDTGSERLRRAIVRAVEDAAPDVERVEVIGAEAGLIPVERLVGRRRNAQAHDRCDLCGEALGSQHAHLFDGERRRLACACAACSVLFDANAKTNLRPVRRKAVPLDSVSISDAQWEALKVPVGLAFFSWSSALATVVAVYPGAAGPIEAAIPLAAWEALVQDNAALAALEPDTQALLVHRRRRGTPRYYMVSIDECYRLAGLVRTHWQSGQRYAGGGDDGPAEQAIEEFFDTLLAKEEERA